MTTRTLLRLMLASIAIQIAVAVFLLVAAIWTGERALWIALMGWCIGTGAVLSSPWRGGWRQAAWMVVILGLWTAWVLLDKCCR